MLTLSLSTTTMDSPLLILSPAALSHETIFPSVMVLERAGMKISLTFARVTILVLLANEAVVPFDPLGLTPQAQRLAFTPTRQLITSALSLSLSLSLGPRSLPLLPSSSSRTKASKQFSDHFSISLSLSLSLSLSFTLSSAGATDKIFSSLFSLFSFLSSSFLFSLLSSPEKAFFRFFVFSFSSVRRLQDKIGL